MCSRHHDLSICEGERRGTDMAEALTGLMEIITNPAFSHVELDNADGVIIGFANEQLNQFVSEIYKISLLSQTKVMHGSNVDIIKRLQRELVATYVGLILHEYDKENENENRIGPRYDEDGTELPF